MAMSFRVLIDEAAPEAVGSLCEVRDVSGTGSATGVFLASFFLHRFVFNNH